jgi:transposase
MKGDMHMVKTQPKYDEDFKRSIVSLHQGGKSQSELSREYGISLSAINRWIKTYTEVKIDNDTVITAKQIKELQKRNALLEEENIILKKAIAIFTPHSGKD